MIHRRVLCATAIAATFATPMLALSGQEKCRIAKTRIVGKYVQCRLKADAKATRRGDAADYSKCQERLQKKWANAEQRAYGRGTLCADSLSATNAQSFLDQQANAIRSSIGPGGQILFGCGDNLINVIGEECDGTALNATCMSLGFAGGTLTCSSTCTIDTSGCFGIVSEFCGDLAINVVGEQCDGTNLGDHTCATLGFNGGTLACDQCMLDVSGCTFDSACRLPATGQTANWGPGSDGQVQAGAPMAFAENGDGTISDLNTGLMWEKKDDSGGVHDKDNTYYWSDLAGTGQLDGTVVNDFLDVLNDVPGGGTNCFAGHCDWRLPNFKEVIMLLNTEFYGYAIDPIFNKPATCPGCTDVTLPTCSCISPSYIWTSTSYIDPFDLTQAWIIDFTDGYTDYASKFSNYAARAVRGPCL